MILMDRNKESLMETPEGRKAYRDMLKVFSSVESPEEMEKLFDDLFTDAEINDFILRWQLMDDLYKGKSQRNIAKERKISLCRITRGSRMLKKKDGFMHALLSSRYDDHLHI